jgi:hypothetical protein
LRAQAFKGIVEWVGYRDQDADILIEDASGDLQGRELTCGSSAKMVGSVLGPPSYLTCMSHYNETLNDIALRL